MRTIRPAAPLALLLIAILLAACGGSAAGPILSGVGSAADGDGGQAAPEVPAGEAGSGEQPAPDDGTRSGGDGVGAPLDDARIIRTGVMELEVGNVPTAVARARDAIRGLGGYIGASTTSSQDDRPIATITYRIPADRWEDALDVLRLIDSTGTKVVTERTEAVEVTGQVIDLEARIRNLQASEAALQEIAASATRIPDVLEVQNQLTQVRGQIEQLTAQLTDLEDRAALATLSVTFRMPVVAVEVAQKGWEPGVVVDEALASLVGVLQGLTSLGIWFAIVWLPLIVAIALVVAVALAIGRRLGLLQPRRRSGEPAAG
jgi:hypothetical protein